MNYHGVWLIVGILANELILKQTAPLTREEGWAEAIVV